MIAAVQHGGFMALWIEPHRIVRRTYLFARLTVFVLQATVQSQKYALRISSDEV